MQPTDELFRQCERIIDYCVNRVASRYRCLDVDELKSMARYVFCDAAVKYDPSKKASFKTYLFDRLKCLHDEADRVMMPDGHNGRTKPMNIDDFSDSCRDVLDVKVDMKAIVPASIEYSAKLADDGYSDMIGFCERVLSPEAMNVVGNIERGAVDPSKGRMNTGRARYSKMCVIDAKRMWLRRYRNMGWTVEKCEKTLDEIRKAVRQFNRGGLPCRIVPEGV